MPKIAVRRVFHARNSETIGRARNTQAPERGADFLIGGKIDGRKLVLARRHHELVGCAWIDVHQRRELLLGDHQLARQRLDLRLDLDELALLGERISSGVARRGAAFGRDVALFVNPIKPCLVA